MYVQNYFEVCYGVFTKTRNLLKLRTMESFTLTRNQIKKFQRIVSGTLDASYQVCMSTRISPKYLHWQKTTTRAALEVVDSYFQCNYQLMTLWSGSTWRIPWGRGLVVLCLLWPACESSDWKTWISFRCPTCEHATALRLKVGLDDQTNRPLDVGSKLPTHYMDMNCFACCTPPTFITCFFK